MTIKEARNIVETVFDLDISTKSRLRHFVAARSVYYFICKVYGNRISYEEFTEYIGFRHSTVINALHKMENDIETNGWEFGRELQRCKDAAVLKSDIDGTWLGEEFRKIEDVNRKFKTELYQLFSSYERAINGYENKIKQDAIQMLQGDDYIPPAPEDEKIKKIQTFIDEK